MHREKSGWSPQMGTYRTGIISSAACYKYLFEDSGRQKFLWIMNLLRWSFWEEEHIHLEDLLESRLWKEHTQPIWACPRLAIPMEESFPAYWFITDWTENACFYSLPPSDEPWLYSCTESLGSEGIGETGGGGRTTESNLIHKIPYLSGYTEGRNGSSEGGNFLQLEYLLFHRDCMPILGINHFTGENTRDERRWAYLSFY